MKMADVYWLAGLLEGEGYFGFKSGTCKIVVEMSDEDIILRASDLLQCVSKPRPAKENRKPCWRAEISGYKAAQWMMTLYCLLGLRRKEKIKKCLLSWYKVSVSNRVRTTCAQGHIYTEKSLYLYKGKRFCRICRTVSNASWKGGKV